MGRGLPLQKTKLTAYLREMEVCIIQIIDRIASTQLGPSREEAIEFVKHIPIIDDIENKQKRITMPTRTLVFPDFAAYHG
jgi:hypothetical protein